MAYTPVGPFTDNSSTPPINAAFLNGVENTLTSVGQISSTVTVTSGGSTTIALPNYSAGLVLINCSSGGAWQTGYVGAYVTSPSGAIITQLSSQNMAPGNLIASVTASSTSLSLTVTLTATGSNSSLSSVVLRASP
jgi:hypothetical protein